MKFKSIGMVTLMASMLTITLQAQNYTIDWYKVAGGGGTSSGGTYSISGTIGQADAGGPLTGGNISIAGGFWSMINVVQMPGVPQLIILPNGANSVTVLWPDPATNTYTLQQTGNLAGHSWATSSYIPSNVGGTNFVTITPPVGNVFFRLKQ